jgi:murein DD-endopeptidase MepM/ murein hydrolase activator NlpD
MIMMKKAIVKIAILGFVATLLSGCLTQDPAQVVDKSSMYFGRDSARKIEAYPEMDPSDYSSVTIKPLQPLQNQSHESVERKSTSGYLQAKKKAPVEENHSKQLASKESKEVARKPNTTYEEDLTYEAPDKGSKVELGTNAEFVAATPLNLDKFEWPVSGGKVLARFGKHGNKFNEGINIGAPIGSNVNAAGDGKVIYIGSNIEGYGNLIIIKHDGDLMTAYSHVKDVLVERGNKVTKGQRIATVGNSGNVKDPQVHFSIRKGKKTINPEQSLAS